MIPDVQKSSSSGAATMVPEAWTVAERSTETDDTFTLRLAPPEARTSFEFLPGQFNMLYGFGTGESAISISGDPAETDTLVHTIRRVGTVTRALSELRHGDPLGVRGPFGSAWPVERMFGHDLIFLAGGIGLAPLRPAILYALAHRARYGNIVILLGSRSPADIIFLKEIDAWTATAGIEARVSVDRATPDWQRNVGVVTNLIPKAKFDSGKAIAMLCGPEIMMRYSVVELHKRGLDDAQIFLTMERNMKCAVGFCGHCQLGPEFLCRDGPVFRYDRIKPWFSQREL